MNTKRITVSEILEDIAWSFGYEQALIISNRRDWPNVPELQDRSRAVRSEMIRILRRWLPELSRKRRLDVGRIIAETMNRLKTETRYEQQETIP